AANRGSRSGEARFTLDGRPPKSLGPLRHREDRASGPRGHECIADHGDAVIRRRSLAVPAAATRRTWRRDPRERLEDVLGVAPGREPRAEGRAVTCRRRPSSLVRGDSPDAVDREDSTVPTRESGLLYRREDDGKRLAHP